MIHHGYPSKWMYLSWIHNEFSIQISARCCVLMHMLVDVIGFSTNLGISSIKTGSLCYPFKRTSGYIPINMENNELIEYLLQYPVTLFHKKSGFCHRCQDGWKFQWWNEKISQETTNRYTTHTTKKLDETSLYLPGKQDILSQHNITKMDFTCHQQRWRYT
jgi:hypothetical protein